MAPCMSTTILILLLTAYLCRGRGIEDNFGGTRAYDRGTPSEGSQESASAVLVELSDELLENLQTFWKGRRTDFELSNVTLATFDSSGLRHRQVCGNASDFLRAVTNLRGSRSEDDTRPTFHAINELLQAGFTGGSIVLIAGSKPSDEDFGDVLAEILVGRNRQLSVLWMGQPDVFAYSSLRNVAAATGGKFDAPSNVGKPSSLTERVGQPTSETERISDENGKDPYGRIKFPENLENLDADDQGLTSRIGIDRAAANQFFPVTVDVASGASLEVRPGTSATIPFTVKNNFNIPLKTVFGAKFANTRQLINPQEAVLRPMSTITVRMLVQSVPNNFGRPNSTVTFSAFVSNKAVHRSAIVSFVPQTTYDKTEPRLDYKYGGDCAEFQELQTCEKGLWSMKVTAQDEESGILKIVSEPYGLLFQPDFLAGTKAPVTAYYTATCCQPKVDIWVEDLKGNYVKKSFDVNNQTLLAGEIAAIVIGVILLLFIIIAIIVIISLVKRRNRRNLIIPRSRADSR